MIVNIFKFSDFLFFMHIDGFYEELEVWKLFKEKCVYNVILFDEIIKKNHWNYGKLYKLLIKEKIYKIKLIKFKIYFIALIQNSK